MCAIGLQAIAVRGSIIVSNDQMDTDMSTSTILEPVYVRMTVRMVVQKHQKRNRSTDWPRRSNGRPPLISVISLRWSGGEASKRGDHGLQHATQF